MNKQKQFRRPDALPKLRRRPKVGELLYYQDLDGVTYPLVVIEVNYPQTKTKDIKMSKNIRKIAHPSVECIIEGRQTTILISDLRIAKQ